MIGEQDADDALRPRDLKAERHRDVPETFRDVELTMFRDNTRLT